MANNSEKPWVELGLTDYEYNLIKDILGREPNFVELNVFPLCGLNIVAIKFKNVLKTFPTEGPQVLQGPGENAGVVDIGMV